MEKGRKKNIHNSLPNIYFKSTILFNFYSKRLSQFKNLEIWRTVHDKHWPLAFVLQVYDISVIHHTVLGHHDDLIQYKFDRFAQNHPPFVA